MKQIDPCALRHLCFGFIVASIGSSLYIYCGLGSDAFNVLNQGIARVLGIQVGTASCLAQGVLLALVLRNGRSYIGIGTLLGPFLVGVIMNGFAFFFAVPLQAASLTLRLFCLTLAPFFVGFGVAWIKHSRLGMTPYDIVPLLLYQKARRRSFPVIRICVDAFSFVLGIILGGTVGIGTVLSVLLTGPAIQIATTIIIRSQKA